MRTNPNVRAYWGRIAGMDRYDLHVLRYGADGSTEYLTQPSPGVYEWVPFVEGSDIPALLSLPGTIIGNVREAFDECWRGMSPDPGTEAKVLREVLALEQDRVNRIIEKALR